MQNKAHLPSLVSKAHKVGPYSGDLGVSIHRDQSVYEVGECSRLAMESPVVLVSPEAPTGDILPFPIHDQATEPIIHTPVASHPVCEGDSAALIPTEESRHHGDHGFVGARSVPSLGSRWVDSNRFSILANLGREEDPWSEEDVGFGFSKSQTEEYDGDAPHTGKKLVDGPLGGSKLLLLPREHSGADSGLSGSGVHECGTLECVPLSRWDSKAAKDTVLTRVEEEGAQSNWVSNMMSRFCKMVGFPIVQHEPQCVA